MPLEDRAADTWEPLIAVADLAGGTWPDLARDAAVALAADQDSEARTSDGIRLLADIRAAFAALGNPEAATTKDLLRALNADPEAPWAAIGTGGLTGKRLGDMLGDFEIRPAPEAIRFEVGRARGYTRQAFTDAWRRYCPPARRGYPCHPCQACLPRSTPTRITPLTRINPCQVPALTQINPCQPSNPCRT